MQTLTGSSSGDNDVEVVLALEQELQTDRCRRDPHRLGDLLAADFTEIGASGAAWDKASILDMLAGESRTLIEVIDLSGCRISPDIVLVRWISRTPRGRARRTSLWRRATSGWELVHHQGTPLA